MKNRIISTPSFNASEWRTPDTYGSNYERLPEGPGIYLFSRYDIDESEKTYRHKVLYVGMSTNIANRCSSHEISRLFDPEIYAQIYFQHHSENLREIEAKYIKLFDPPFNIIGRPRGM